MHRTSAVISTSEMAIYQQREWGDDMLLAVLLRGESDYEGSLGLPARFGCGRWLPQRSPA